MSALGGVGSAIEADLTAIKAALTWSNEATAFSDEDRAPLAPGPFSFEGRSLRPDAARGDTRGCRLKDRPSHRCARLSAVQAHRLIKAT